MDHSEQIELIEKYLNGALTPEEIKAVEEQIAVDANFRAELELHRQIHEEFSDRKKLELRDILTEITKQVPASPRKKLPGFGWAGVFCVILLACWAGWRLFSAKQSREAVEPREVITADSTTVPKSMPDTAQKQEPPGAQKPNRPIAMVDPQAFKPSQNFEDRLSNKLRSAGEQAQLLSPKISENFTPENGMVKIRFLGTAPAEADSISSLLILKIYNNSPLPDSPVYQIVPSITNSSQVDTQWSFDITLRLRLKAGLYYFTLERQADEDLLYTGKFFVGRK